MKRSISIQELKDKVVAIFAANDDPDIAVQKLEEENIHMICDADDRADFTEKLLGDANDGHISVNLVYYYDKSNQCYYVAMGG